MPSTEARYRRNEETSRFAKYLFYSHFKASECFYYRSTLRKTRRQVGPLKSTSEQGYIDESRIRKDRRYGELGVELLCCICQNVLWKPVACTTCENAFCAACIRTWTNKQTSSKTVTCPFNCKFQEKRAPPILNNLLSKLQICCAYAPNGCRETVSYDALEKHEETCQHERTPCQVCETPVSNRDQNNKHELKQCFQQMYDRDPNQIQAQFLKLLEEVEASQQRIQVLENLLGVSVPEKK